MLIGGNNDQPGDVYSKSCYVPIPLNGENTTNFITKLTQLKNLPVEILENIALKLPVEDYNNLRATCRSLKDKLITLNAMKPASEKICEGDRKIAYKRMAIEAELMSLLKTSSPEIRQALSHVMVEQSNNDTDHTAIFFPYPADKWEHSMLEKTLRPFSLQWDEIVYFQDLFDNKFIRCTLMTKSLNPETFDKIFSLANEVYSQCDGAEKLVLASMMAGLRDHLSLHLPAHKLITTEHVNNMAAYYPKLFSMGNHIRKKIPLEKILIRNEQTDVYANIALYKELALSKIKLQILQLAYEMGEKANLPDSDQQKLADLRQMHVNTQIIINQQIFDFINRI